MEFNTVKFAIWLLFIIIFPIEGILAIVTTVSAWEIYQEWSLLARLTWNTVNI